MNQIIIIHSLYEIYFLFIWTSFQIATDRWDLPMDASMTVKYLLPLFITTTPFYTDREERDLTGLGATELIRWRKEYRFFQ